jgi:predicted anti-sigma-YlaC factor YlaD
MGALKAGCERAREWVSLELDDELSELGTARLHRHLCRCSACETLSIGVNAATELLRDAPLEEPSIAVIVVPRRRVSVRRASLAAAVAMIVAGGLAGSLAPEPQAALRTPYFEHQLLAHVRDAHGPHGSS